MQDARQISIGRAGKRRGEQLAGARAQCACANRMERDIEREKVNIVYVDCGNLI